MAVHAPHFVSGWSTEQRMKMVRYFETARLAPGGPSYVRYLDRASRDLVAKLNPEEQLSVLKNGETWPNAALGALAGLPERPDQAMLEQLQALDKRMARRDSEVAGRLRLGIIAVMARSGDVESMEYLRTLFENEPERRSMIAMGLAQDPTGENWPLLVRALPILDGEAAHEVLTRLAKSNLRPAEPEPVRQVILLGMKQPANPGRRAAIKLLEEWTDHPQLLWDAVYETLRAGVDLIVHVGPEPYIMPATFTPDNVSGPRPRIALSATGPLMTKVAAEVDSG